MFRESFPSIQNEGKNNDAGKGGEVKMGESAGRGLRENWKQIRDAHLTLITWCTSQGSPEE